MLGTKLGGGSSNARGGGFNSGGHVSKKGFHQPDLSGPMPIWADENLRKDPCRNHPFSGLFRPPSECFHGRRVLAIVGVEGADQDAGVHHD